MFEMNATCFIQFIGVVNFDVYDNTSNYKFIDDKFNRLKSSLKSETFSYQNFINIFCNELVDSHIQSIPVRLFVTVIANLYIK